MKIKFELEKIAISSLLTHIIPLVKIGLIAYNQESQVIKINREFYYSCIFYIVVNLKI